MREALKNIMITIIDGWWGSGKSTLRGLLDGHSELFVCPVQDSILGGFSCDSNLNKWLVARDIVGFRKSLIGHADYSRVERDALKQSVFNTASGAEMDNGRFALDFYELDRQLIRAVNDFEQWSIEEIVELYYQKMASLWDDYPSGDFRGYVSMDNNCKGTAEFLLKNSDRAKYIWVDRDSAGILSTHAKRKPLDGYAGTAGWGQMSVQQFIREGEVRRIETKRMQIERLAKSYPDRVHIVSIDTLVEETEAAMAQVSRFLGLKHEPILNRFTYCGQDFEGSDKYLGKMNDTPESVFTHQEIELIAAAVRRVRRLPIIDFELLRRVRRAVIGLRNGWIQ
tara:strand:- start:7748 stop:8764 length:1017 start_codon:yes stop_codon:yes gene_type:complete